MRCRLLPPFALLALAAGCAAPTVVAPPPVVATLPPPPAVPAMPAGGYPGMRIPARLADGRYPTPNLALSAAAAVWHLRGALNVAALACDRAGGPYVSAYNGWLRTRATVLAAASKRYTAEAQAGGGSDWRDTFDGNQTRLYNFYTQPASHDGFCGVALEELNAVAAVPDADLPEHARAALARLDRPFTDFYAAFDRWRGAQAVAAVAPMPASAPPSMPAQPVAVAALAPPPARPAPRAEAPPILTIPSEALN